MSEGILPEQQLKDGEHEKVFTALQGLKFEDVMRSAGTDKSLTFDKKFVCRLKDSTVYTLKIAQSDGKTFVACDVEFTDKIPVTKEEGVVESEEELKKKEAKLLAHDNAKELSTRHSGWVYEISEVDARNFVKKRSDLITTKVEEDVDVSKEKG